MSSATVAFDRTAVSLLQTKAGLADLVRPESKPVRPRGDRRFIVNQPAQLFVANAPGQTWKAQILDISRCGMQLLADMPVLLGAKVRVEWYGRDIRGTIRYQRKDGNEYRLGVELSSSWQSLVSDVLDRQAEELRASNATLARQAAILQQQADLLDLTYDTILVTGMTGTIQSWNHGAEQMYGWSKTEAVGRNAHELLKTVFSHDLREVEAELLGKGRWDGELVQIRKDGSRIVVASRWALQRTVKGDPAAIMAINSDITAKKQAEEELRLHADALKERNQDLAMALRLAREGSAVKSRFLASVSHELRTPLNGIIGFSQMLYDGVIGPVGEDQKDCLSDVLNCSNHLLTLINHVLDLSKIESGKMVFEYESVSLAELVQETIDSVRSIATAKHIDVRLWVDPLLDRVEADPSKIRQVVFNYVSNALKFSPRGGVVIVDVRAAGASEYRIQVEDHGIGIRAEDLPRLFTEFGQLGPKAQSGTGLGLAITKRIVEALGGRVGVESAFGQGSRFYAILPNRP